MNKEKLITVTGLIGSAITNIFGGWTTSISTLLIFMVIDYITGIMDAALFQTSLKTESGGLSSKVGFKGIAKKVMILFLILIAYRLDLTLNTHYIRDAVCITFIVNEVLSIAENASLMGITLPSPISKALDVLTNKKN